MNVTRGGYLPSPKPEVPPANVSAPASSRAPRHRSVARRTVRRGAASRLGVVSGTARICGCLMTLGSACSGASSAAPGGHGTNVTSGQLLVLTVARRVCPARARGGGNDGAAYGRCERRVRIAFPRCRVGNPAITRSASRSGAHLVTVAWQTGRHPTCHSFVHVVLWPTRWQHSIFGWTTFPFFDPVHRV
jgi:hypothetical protein